MRPATDLRIVIVAPDTLAPDPSDPQAEVEAERSRSLRIGMLENGYNIVAVLPAMVEVPRTRATRSTTSTPTVPS